jgi:hypothetical protein
MPFIVAGSRDVSRPDSNQGRRATTWSPGTRSGCRGRPDLLRADGNPPKDIEPITDPDRKFIVIMNDRKINENTL